MSIFNRKESEVQYKKHTIYIEQDICPPQSDVWCFLITDSEGEELSPYWDNGHCGYESCLAMAKMQIDKNN